MKKVYLAAAMILAATVGAQADARFQGDMFITSITNACANDGYGVGNYARIRFRPAKVDGNPTNTGFGIHWGRWATGYQINGKLTSTWKDAQGTGISSFGFNWTGSKLRYLSQSPGTIKASTKTVILKVEIGKFDNVSKCKVVFEGALTKRP